MTGSASSRSSQLVGRVSPVPEGQDEEETPRVSTGRLCRHPAKTRLTPGEGGSPPSSPEHPHGADSDDYLTASERVRWRPQVLKMLAGRKKIGTRKIESTHISLHICQCGCDLRSGASMYRDGWISMMKRVCIPTFLVAYKVILVNGLTHYWGHEHIIG